MTDLTAVVGLDMSLQATGVALWMPCCEPVVTQVKTRSIPSNAVSARLERFDIIRRGIVAFLVANGWNEEVPTRFTIEQPAYSKNEGSAHDRAGNWWNVASWAVDLGPLTEIPPNTMKKFVTGRGNVDKDEVVFRAAREFPGFETLTNNEADALWLAAMDRAHQEPEAPGFAMPVFRRDQLKVVAWA